MTHEWLWIISFFFWPLACCSFYTTGERMLVENEQQRSNIYKFPSSLNDEVYYYLLMISCLLRGNISSDLQPYQLNLNVVMETEGRCDEQNNTIKFTNISWFSPKTREIRKSRSLKVEWIRRILYFILKSNIFWSSSLIIWSCLRFRLHFSPSSV